MDSQLFKYYINGTLITFSFIGTFNIILYNTIPPNFQPPSKTKLLKDTLQISIFFPYYIPKIFKELFDIYF